MVVDIMLWRRRGSKMLATSENKKEFSELGVLIEDMKNYLSHVEQGCQELSTMFHEANKLKPMEMLTQIMEGLGYYQKLLKSAAIFLTIDFSTILWEKTSISSLLDRICQVFTGIFQAVENEDYSLLTDLIEYDLIPVISISHGMLEVVQGLYEERII
jgi:light-regulated signal transduction histidine kinase (bacteriophytochrome)